MITYVLHYQLDPFWVFGGARKDNVPGGYFSHLQILLYYIQPWPLAAVAIPDSNQ